MPLLKVRNVEVLVITRNQAADPRGVPVVQTYLHGAQLVRDQVQLTGQLNYTSFEQAGHSDAWPAMQVSGYPTILFIDMDSSRIITRLVGNQINVTSVSGTLLEINRLQKDAAGNYFDADGNWLADEASENAVFTSPFGLGLFNVRVPPLLWLGLGLYSAKKALDSKMAVGQVGYSAIAFMTFNEYQKRLNE